MKITITRSTKEQNSNSGTIKFENLTEGQMLAILHALQERSGKSQVCIEILNQFNNETCNKWPAIKSE